MLKGVMASLLIMGLGCTYNVYETEDDMDPKKEGRASGILGSKNAANIGNSKIIDPGILPAGFVFEHDFDLIPTISAADGQYNTEDLSLAVSAIQTTIPGASPDVDNVSLYGVLTWEDARALFGFTQEPIVASAAGGQFVPEVLFDIQNGTVLTLPATQATRLKIRYIARSQAGFPGNTPGPKFRVNAGFSYGGVTPSDRITFTKIPTTSNVGNPWLLVKGGATCEVVKPPFASSVQFTWNQYRTSGPLDIRFIGNNGVNVWGDIRLAAAGTAPPILPWPEEARSAIITNSDGANDMFYVRAVNLLNL